MKPENDVRSRAEELPYRAIVENSLDAIALIRRDASVLYASPAIARVIGYPPAEFQGRNVFEFIHPDDVERSRTLFAKMLEEPGASITAEVRCRHRDGSWRVIEVIGVNRFDDPEVGALIANCRGITDRKLVVEALRRSEERFRLLADNSFDLIGLFDTKGKVLYASPSHFKVLGWEPEDLLHASLFEILHPDDANRALGAVQAVLESGGSEKVEIRLRRKTGAYLDVEAILSPAFADGEPCILFAARDMTERMEMENRLRTSHEQLRRLSSRLTTAREEERTRIAREIHDELGQRVTVLKMAVARLRRPLPREPEVQEILKSIDELLQKVRDLSTELRPAVLDHLELVEALEWQARDFESRTGIPCRLVSRVDRVTVEPGTKTDLYRVTQEALTNVARHAGASRVQIQVSHEAGDLLLEIADNGQGIKEEDLNRNSLGLLGIRERIQGLGGTVRLTNAPQGGMRLRIRIPLERETK